MIVVIRQYDDDSKTLSLVDNSGLLVSTQVLESLEEIANIPYERLILILPGKQIRLLPIKIPALSQQDLQHAVPNMLEEFLSEDTHLLHFSIGPENSHHERHVGVIKKTLWNELLHKLAIHEIRPDLIIPDYLTIPYSTDCWSLYYDDNTAIVRTSINDGFNADLALVTTLLELRLSEALVKPKRLNIIKDPQSTRELTLTLPIILETSINSFEKTIAPQELLISPPFNMLQRVIPKKQTKKMRSYWQWCGLTFVSFIAFLFLSQAILYVDLRIKSANINRQMTALSTILSPGSEDLTTSKWGVEQLLKKYERDPNPFMLLLEKIAPILSHFKLIQLSSITYDNKKLILTLSSSSNDAFNAFNEALSHAGLTLSQTKTQSDHKATFETLTIELGES